MYARQVDDQVLTFSVSGVLWRNGLVLFDRETKSFWGHLLGQCMRGEMKGKRLLAIPSVVTAWATWHEKYPETNVLDLSHMRTLDLSHYDNPSEFVVGIAGSKSAKAWTFPQLLENPLINDEFEGIPIVVSFDRTVFVGRAFHRTLEGESLTFSLVDGEVIDDQSKSTWDLVTGKAIEGPHAGRELRALPAVTSYIYAWTSFHPSSEFWRPN